MRTWADEVEDQRRERDREQRRLIECQHGALFTHCEICKRDARIAELEAALTRNEIIARRLMEIAAAHSVNATQGWASHTCVTLSEAARLLRGEPEPKQDDNAIGVLSEHI